MLPTKVGCAAPHLRKQLIGNRLIHRVYVEDYLIRSLKITSLELGLREVRNDTTVNGRINLYNPKDQPPIPTRKAEEAIVKDENLDERLKELYNPKKKKEIETEVGEAPSDSNDDDEGRLRSIIVQFWYNYSTHSNY